MHIHKSCYTLRPVNIDNNNYTNLHVHVFWTKEQHNYYFQLHARTALAYRVSLVEELDRLWYVHLILPEVIERPLYQHTLLLVILDQLVPKRMLSVRACVCVCVCV